MRTLCDRCNKEVDTEGVLKGQRAFNYSISRDTEPHINTAVSRTKNGYLCYDCSKTIYNAIVNGITPIYNTYNNGRR